MNSRDYVAASRRVISSAVVKGIQDGLVAGLTYSRLGADLSRVDGHHSSAEAEYQSALQDLREFEFPLFAALLANKDSRIGDIMELLRLDGPLANIPDMASLQPDLEQLFVPIWHPMDSAPIGAEPLSNALERCEEDFIKIKKSISSVEEALLCRVSPFFETTPVFTSVDT